MMVKLKITYKTKNTSKYTKRKQIVHPNKLKLINFLAFNYSHLHQIDDIGYNSTQNLQTKFVVKLYQSINYNFILAESNLR